ncbi:MAG: Fur family transcriptional regulator [Pelolinea sp.]|nr:Fur family transcriptional regulator [Pelolinea sp.]
MENPNTVTIQKEWERQLQQTGSRLTEPRRAILKVITESDHPLTPIQIYDQARQSEPYLGLVTVYRTIEILENLHLIDRIHNLGQCQTIFRGTSGHQHLLTCTQCGSSVHFEGLLAEAQFEEIAAFNGYKISGHWLQLYGLCQQCLKEEHEN